MYSIHLCDQWSLCTSKLCMAASCRGSLYNLSHVGDIHTQHTAATTPPDIIIAATIVGTYCYTMSTPSSSTPQPTPSQQAQSAAATPQFVAYPLAPGQQPQLLPQASSSNEGRSQPQTRLPSAETRKDRSLVDFLLMLDDYEPLVCLFVRCLRSPVSNSLVVLKIPDEVTEYYLQRVGFDCQDARL
jgi:hypothetical protein